jgi:hypothetical protein
MQRPPEDDRIWPKYVEEGSSSNFYVFYLFVYCVGDFYPVKLRVVFVCLVPTKIRVITGYENHERQLLFQKYISQHKSGKFRGPLT